MAGAAPDWGVKTERALSAGGVVVRSDRGRYEVVVLTRSGGAVKCLPKGTVEAGESHEAAAVREVREEGGIDAEILAPLPAVDYWFYWRPDKTRYHKFVHFFVMRYLGGDVADHDDEVEGSEWIELKDAPAILTYAGEKQTVLRATQWLEEHRSELDTRGTDRA